MWKHIHLFIPPPCRTNPDELLGEIRRSEPLVTESRADQVKQLILRLQQKQGQKDQPGFCFSKVGHWTHTYITGISSLHEHNDMASQFNEIAEIVEDIHTNSITAYNVMYIGTDILGTEIVH